MQRPTTHIAAAANQGMTGQLVQLEILPREERPEDERPERRAEEGSEEDVRDRPRLLLLRIHVCGGGPEPRAPLRSSRRLRRIRGSRAGRCPPRTRERSAGSPTCRRRNRPRSRAPARYGPSGAPRGAPRRRPRSGRWQAQEAEDGLDPGDEDERDRRDGDGQLQHAREQNQAETEQRGVTPYRIGLRLDRAIQPAKRGMPARRERRPSFVRSSDR